MQETCHELWWISIESYLGMAIQHLALVAINASTNASYHNVILLHVVSCNISHFNQHLNDFLPQILSASRGCLSPVSSSSAKDVMHRGGVGVNLN